jgi:S-DNA-T family DNA segregation ATPase FtsK/SpoIIIE
VELSLYAGVPHVERIVTEPEEAAEMFAGLVEEMENRYRRVEAAGARNITSYNRAVAEKMPYIVVVVDEMADLIMSVKEIEVNIVRLAQKARAVGIHLVLATQKPVVKVITGLIKSNIPSRLAFQVASMADSRVILDVNGAEKLAGRGDMLAVYVGVNEPERLHGAWVSDSEIASVVKALGR